MSKPMIRVEVTVPRTVVAQWATQAQREGALRAQGLLHPQAEQVRWRIDYASAGYIVEYVVAWTAKDASYDS